MKISKFILFILFPVFLGLYQTGWAADMAGMEMEASGAPATIELTLPKAETLALQGNPHIHAADKRVDAAGKQSLQTLAPADPTFIIDDTIPGMNMWQVEENLGFPGKSFAQVDVDNAETGKQQALAADTRREILLQARQTFWDFYYRQKVYEVLAGAQKQLKTLDELLKSRELTGQWLSMKTVRAQLEIANATNDLFTSSDALEVSKANFNHLFSMPHGTAYILKEIPALPPLAGTVQAFIQEALARNPKVQEARKELAEAGAEARVAALSHLPDLTVALSGARNTEDNGFSSYGFRVGVSVPLFFLLKQTQATDQANDRMDASRYELTGAQNEATHMVEDAYVDTQSAWRLWKLYEEGGLLAQAQRAWRATQAAYRNDQISLSDFMDNYNLYLDTLKAYFRAQADYGKTLAELDYQIGNLPVSGNEKE